MAGFTVWLLYGWAIAPAWADPPLHPAPPAADVRPHFQSSLERVGEALPGTPLSPDQLTRVALNDEGGLGGSGGPDVTVYGYWPYWGDPLSTMPWDELTHLAVFSVALESNGTLSSTSTWHTYAPTAMSYGAAHGVKIHLCVTAFYDSVMNAVLPSPTLRAQAIAQLGALVDQYGADGVNVDFEGLDSSQKANFVAFVQELQARVDEVYVAMPAVDWAGAYDYDELAFASDGLFIMGYGYHWSGGDPGPVSPLFGGTPWAVYSLDWTVDDYRTWGAPDDSIILGLPLYGRDWPTTSTTIPGSATGTGVAVTYSSAVPQGNSYGRHWNAQTHTAYAFPSSTHQLWYDDAQAVEDKVAWAIGEGLQGVGFWAMTYEDSDADLWSRMHDLTWRDEVCTGGADEDGDGLTDCADPDCAGFAACCDKDADGYLSSSGVCGGNDCNDNRADVNPAAVDHPNDAFDQDCDGADDCWADLDGDFFAGTTIIAGDDMICGNTAHEGILMGDCNDGDAAINPAAVEIVADLIDQDCDGVEVCWLDLDGDGWGSTLRVIGDDMSCSDIGESDRYDDCDDLDADTWPGAPETPSDGIDQSCDNQDGVLVLQQPVPGLAGATNTWAIAGATPFSKVHVIAGTSGGSTRIPDCTTAVAVEDVRVVGQAIADANGYAQVQAFVPQAASGGAVAMHAIQRSACAASAAVQYTFP